MPFVPVVLIVEQHSAICPGPARVHGNENQPTGNNGLDDEDEEEEEIDIGMADLAGWGAPDCVDL